MKIAVLMIVLLLPVVGWAEGGKVIEGAKPEVPFFCSGQGCQEKIDRHIFSCYQRMQEAMRVMDEAIQVSRRNYVLQYGAPRDSTLILIYDFSRWDNTMRDCVRGE